jgi:uncharacterized protein (TIGR02598 family)
MTGRGKKRAFSLVEVVLALGIFSFAILSILGLMATGLNTVKSSSTSMTIANISRNLRADLQATPFTSLTLNSSITYYFTDRGNPTTTPANAYYVAVLTPLAPTYPGNAASVLTSANAFNITAKISYPYPINAQAITNSYFVAQ